MGHVTSKPVFGVSDQVRHHPGCTTQRTDGFATPDPERRGDVLSMLRNKDTDRLRDDRATNPRYYARTLKRHSRDVAHMIV